MSIHPTALIDKTVELGRNVEVGPYSILRGQTRIGDNCRIGSHVVIGSDYGIVELGQDNVIHSGAVVGGPPQDLTYKNEATKLEVGDRNQIREFVTLNCGTKKGGGVTRIGSDGLFMAYVHVAHDCQVGNHVVIANTSQLAGHVLVEDHVKIGGVCRINQFVRFGKHAFVAGDASINKDIIPFCIAQGNYAVARAANSIGLERDGFAANDIEGIYKAIRIVTKGGGTIDNAIEEIRASVPASEHIEYLINFMKSSERGIAR